jgi:2-C-methyl-D-erythritol 4-phosphate cytidylyltransferase
MHNTLFLWCLSLTMSSPPTLGIIIPAGGSGKRFGSTQPKQYLPIAGIPSIVRSITTAGSVPGCTTIVVAVAQVQKDVVLSLLDEYGIMDQRIHLVDGGHERAVSVGHALQHPSIREVELVAVHDAVRPLASAELWDRLVKGASVHGSAIPVLPVVDTLKRVADDVIIETIDRSTIRRVQTPQVFRTELITEAYRFGMAESWYGTDCASLCERIGVSVYCVAGEEHNIKITTPFDVLVAELFLTRN